MELINDDSFDPTPKLKSSPVPISFISFNYYDKNCICCGDIYTETSINKQKYCKKCLLGYLTNITDKNIYLDVYIFTRNLECNEHEISMTKEPQNIQECCRNCLEILCFKQIPNCTNFYGNKNDNLINNVFISENYCKLCGKAFLKTNDAFVLCSDCYLISSEYIESTLTKKPIPIIYLPWWYNYPYCQACYLKLKFTSDCQKYCGNCLIFYTGCRYCLTTNVIFGVTNQSQCKKCKRVSSIIFDRSRNSDLNDFFVNLRLEIHNQLEITKFTDEIKNIDKYFCPVPLFNSIYSAFYKNKVEILMEWIPYSQFTNVKKIAEGGFGIIYQATWLDGSINNKEVRLRERKNNETVILKKFNNSQGISKYFLNELKSNQSCYQIKHHIIKTYGFTRDPKFGDYILVMEYASGGDLHNILREKFTEITWDKQKLAILWQISEGLETIHKSEFIHRDFHSGNILSNLSNEKRHRWQIGDLGLSQPVSNAQSNNEIYGVIPYVAPEIFKGSVFSKESDIYCMGMIMWELTTGCKPFANVEHDINLIYKILDGKRPEITEDTPECYVKLMKRCWDSDPTKRPLITEIRKTFGKWFYRNNDLNQFKQAEIKRKELIKLKKLGPEFNGKTHPSAIYTSRLLKSFISSCSSIFSNSKDYNSIELELDIDIKRYLRFKIFGPSLHNLNSNDLNTISSNILGTKRNIEELEINSYGNNGKHIKN
ncbi:kinase-like protein [Rhizophagus irregularis]|uniref:Kinase-like protein n=1 Tax=Rhizophagus irregularis TaxID=588596 RepID=A0A2N0RVD6_9GLOM|nr:kinase-like protein [Rhizophagus irregularis]